MRDVHWLTQQPSAGAADGLSCLLVEPHEAVREAFSGLLRAHSMVVGCASSYTVGLALGTTLRFDVVLTELDLPDGCGRELARALRRNPESCPASLGAFVMEAVDDLELGRAGFDCAIGRLARPAEIVAAVRALAAAGAARRTDGIAAA